MPGYERLMPVSKPCLGEDELSEVRKVFDSGWLGMGRWVFEFEKKIKKLLQAKNAIAVSTGTTALHLALNAIGIRQGDEVLVPSLTFVASVQAIIASGAKPVFCDVEPDTLNMNVEDAARRITLRTKAIMPVHYCGSPCNMDGILELAKRRHLRVIEDAAHAFGSSYKGKKIGSFGDVACFSFDPIKTISCGEGGAITTRDDNLARLIYKKRILGIDKDTWSRYRHQRDWFYKVTTLGFRYHMSNINAAIGLVQLRKINSFIDKRRKIVQKYDNEFKGMAGIDILQRDYKNTAFFNYIIKIKKGRDRLIEFLKKAGIDSGVHYIPNHLQPFFANYKARLPVTEGAYKEIITLPLYYDMSNKDASLVIQKVKEFFEHRR